MVKMKKYATTVYLDPRIARAAKVKAALSDRSLSDMVNESLLRYLSDDQADLSVIRRRRTERVRGYEDFLAELKRDGLI